MFNLSSELPAVSFRYSVLVKLPHGPMLTITSKKEIWLLSNSKVKDRLNEIHYRGWDSRPWAYWTVLSD